MVTRLVHWFSASGVNLTAGPSSLLTMSCLSEPVSTLIKLTGTVNISVSSTPFLCRLSRPLNPYFTLGPDDLEGSRWNMPGDYDTPGFDQCEGDDVPLPMGECESFLAD